MTDAASAGSSTSTAGGGRRKRERRLISSLLLLLLQRLQKVVQQRRTRGIFPFPCTVCPFILRFVTHHPAPRSFSAGAWRRGEKGGEKGPERGLAGRSAHKHLGGKRVLPDAKGSGINTSRVYFSSGSKLTRRKSEEASRRVSGLITGSVCKPQRKKARAPREGEDPIVLPFEGGGRAP